MVKIFFERVPESAAERDAAKVIGSLPYRNLFLLAVAHRHQRSRLILNFFYFIMRNCCDRSTADIYEAFKIWIIRLNVNAEKL